MKQLVTCSTHTHGNTLDLVLTNQHDLVNDLSVNSTTCSAYSDHSLISFHLPIDSLCKNAVKHTIYHYSEADLEGLFSYLDGFSFPAVTDVNSMWSLLKDSIQNARTLFIPSSSHQPRSTPPWFTHEIRHSINCIRSLCRRYRHRPTSTLLSRITALESLLITQIESAKSVYESKPGADLGLNFWGGTDDVSGVISGCGQLRLPDLFLRSQNFEG